jgi:D-alanyl-D-alanine carboxypeptidase
MYAASLTPLPSDNRQLAPAQAVATPANVTTITTVRSEPSPTAAPIMATPPVVAAAAPPPVAPPTPPAAKPVMQPVKVASAVPGASVTEANVEPPAKARGGWLIQVGALPDEKEAKQRLETAQSKVGSLLKANSFTERIEKGDKVLFRARFAGLEKDQAEAACKHLKHSNIPCMLLKN